MKSKIVGEKNEMGYPRIVKMENGLVVLLEKPMCGTVLVQGDSPYPVGDYTDNWALDDCEVLDKVTIEFKM